MTVEKVNQFMQTLGDHVKGAGKIYFTGGVTALLSGWRNSTVDMDLKLDPEPEGAFELIEKLKRELQMNVELASPDQFLPALDNWQNRSIFIGRYGKVDFYHYDLYAQALAKISRGYQQDLNDAREMVTRGLVKIEKLKFLFDQIKPQLIRFPSIDQLALEIKLNEFLSTITNRDQK